MKAGIHLRYLNRGGTLSLLAPRRVIQFALRLLPSRPASLLPIETKETRSNL